MECHDYGASSSFFKLDIMICVLYIIFQKELLYLGVHCNSLICGFIVLLKLLKTKLSYLEVFHLSVLNC